MTDSPADHDTEAVAFVPAAPPPDLIDFKYAHLPAHLQAVSKPFHDLALHIIKLPDNKQREYALHYLATAKDNAVRAFLKGSK